MTNCLNKLHLTMDTFATWASSNTKYEVAAKVFLTLIAVIFVVDFISCLFKMYYPEENADASHIAWMNKVMRIRILCPRLRIEKKGAKEGTGEISNQDEEEAIKNSTPLYCQDISSAESDIMCQEKEAEVMKYETESNTAHLSDEYERFLALGKDRFAEKKFGEAIKFLNQACTVIYSKGVKKTMATSRQNFYRYITCNVFLADCFYNTKNFECAISYASEALSKNKKNAKALYLRGMSFLSLFYKVEEKRSMCPPSCTCMKNVTNGRNCERCPLHAFDTPVLYSYYCTDFGEKALADFKSVLVLFPANEMVEANLKKAVNMSFLRLAQSMEKTAVLELEDRLLSLLKLGANVNVRESSGFSNSEFAKRDFSPLMLAARTGNSKIAELLLSNGANVNDKTKNGFFPLYIASENGHFSIVELLLSKGGIINDKANCGSSALFVATQKGYDHIVELLLSKGANADDKNLGFYSPLYLACKYGHINIIKLLLSHGASINETCDGFSPFDSKGNSPLMTASMNGRERAVGLLLDEGANVNETNKNGYNALMIASKHGLDNIVELLLSRGADMSEKNNNNASSLLIACGAGHASTVKLLLSKGAIIHINDKLSSSGATPLMIASHYGYLEVAELLLTFGANLRDRSYNGLSSFIIASKPGSKRHLNIQNTIQRWPVTMAAIMFDELLVYNTLFDSLFDLYQYLNLDHDD